MVGLAVSSAAVSGRCFVTHMFVFFPWELDNCVIEKFSHLSEWFPDRLK